MDYNTPYNIGFSLGNVISNLVKSADYWLSIKLALY